MKRLFITGGNGQLGRALQTELATDYEVISGDLPEADITRPALFYSVIEAAAPDLIIHCAAYTDVDGCALNPALANLVNALGTQHVAQACHTHGIPMVHISTNEVFAGDKPAGYTEWMPLNPANPYGRSKAAAEFAVRSLLPRHFIVRTAWMFAPAGHNFIHTILRLAREKAPLRVVTDEIGNPTYAPDLAWAIRQLIERGQYGTYHLVNEGACSRWAFARQILRTARMAHIPVEPILSRRFQRPSSPPRFGALINDAAAALDITLRPWPAALTEFMQSLKKEYLDNE